MSGKAASLSRIDKTGSLESQRVILMNSDKLAALPDIT